MRFPTHSGTTLPEDRPTPVPACLNRRPQTRATLPRGSWSVRTLVVPSPSSRRMTALPLLGGRTSRLPYGPEEVGIFGTARWRWLGEHGSSRGGLGEEMGSVGVSRSAWASPAGWSTCYRPRHGPPPCAQTSPSPTCSCTRPGSPTTPTKTTRSRPTLADYASLWQERPNYRMLRPIDFLPVFADLPPYRPPGQTWQYCNASYILPGSSSSMSPAAPTSSWSRNASSTVPACPPAASAWTNPTPRWRSATSTPTPPSHPPHQHLLGSRHRRPRRRRLRHCDRPRPLPSPPCRHVTDG